MRTVSAFMLAAVLLAVRSADLAVCLACTLSADGECIMNFASEAEAIWTLRGTVFSRPMTSFRWPFMESRNESTSWASDTVTTRPSSPRVCPSEPPVNPMPYLLAASSAPRLESRVIPLHITS